MIRSARYGDLPDIVKMGRRFFAASGYGEITEWNGRSFLTAAKWLSESELGVLLVLDTGKVCGMAGAVLYPFYCNAAHRTGQEMFFWVEPEARGRDSFELLDALEAAAKRKGAESFIMVSTDGMRSDALARLYRRKGYRPAENTFIRRL